MVYRSIKKALSLVTLAFSLATTLVAQQAQLAKPAVTNEPATLSFNEFFAAPAQGLKPSDKLISLNNKHVKLTGFMAQMENELEGLFYLVPRPVFCDEEGAGNADIPPEAVLVVVRFRSEQKIPFVGGPIEVTGILEVGNKETNGRVSAIRLIMDGPGKDSNQPISKKTSN